MYMDTGLTKNKYNKLRAHSKILKSDQIYPAYKKIFKAKSACYPEKILVTETGGSVDFVTLLEHTTKRILLSLGLDTLKEVQN